METDNPLLGVEPVEPEIERAGPEFPTQPEPPAETAPQEQELPSILQVVNDANPPNWNILSAGASGTGKSESGKAILLHEITREPDMRVLILDNNNEYRGFVKQVGGKVWDVAKRGLPFNHLIPAYGVSPEAHVEALLADLEQTTQLGALQIDEVRTFLLEVGQQRLSLPQIRQLAERRLSGKIFKWLRCLFPLCKEDVRDETLFRSGQVVALELNGLMNPHSRIVAAMLSVGETLRRNMEVAAIPVRIVIEEAQLLHGMRSQERLLREGRKFNIRTTLITQCIADLDRYVLTNCGQWVVFQCDSANARKAASSANVDNPAELARRIVSLKPYTAMHICGGRITEAQGALLDESNVRSEQARTVPQTREQAKPKNDYSSESERQAHAQDASSVTVTCPLAEKLTRRDSPGTLQVWFRRPRMWLFAGIVALAIWTIVNSSFVPGRLVLNQARCPVPATL